jgi:hypothetical protein
MAHELFCDGMIGKISSSRLKRAFLWAMIVWFPPVIAVIIGRFTHEQFPKIGLLQDFAFHVRSLLAVPFLVIIEKYIYRAGNLAIPNSLERGIIKGDKAVKMEAFRSKIHSLQSSIWSEIFLLMISLSIVYSQSYIDLENGVSTWKTMQTFPYVFARFWNQWVGVNIYFYFILRWVFKFSLWSAFLIKLSLLKPHLEYLHPDKMGGIAFLPRTQVLFGGFASAFSMVAMANISSSVLYGKIPFEKFYLPLAIYGITVTCFFIAPLASLTPHLLEAKRIGIRDYAVLSSKYSALFRRKWLEKEMEDSESLLGSSDIQSLNDLMGSFLNLKMMRVFAMSPRFFLVLLCFIAGPLLPLFLLKVPLSEAIYIVIKHFL